MADDDRESGGSLNDKQRAPAKDPGSGRPTIPCTELPDSPPGSPIKTEWDFYRRVVGRLVAEGHEGKWLLIKAEEIAGIWDTEAEANEARVQRFAMQPVLMKQVLAREPVLRIGYNRLCPS
jgi:hypothetical protein